MRKSHGELTAEIGQSLNFDNYEVLFDHGISGENIGKIVSYFGDKNQRGTQLSYLDIALVKKSSNKVVALIEIEEKANRPKTIIADIFGFLMGEKLTFHGKELELCRLTLVESCSLPAFHDVHASWTVSGPGVRV